MIVTKDSSVELELHPKLTAFLFILARSLYEKYSYTTVVTSGSEKTAKHSVTSLHYADPCCAVDLRSWDITHGGKIIRASEQVKMYKELASDFCKDLGIPDSWLEIIEERTHIHIEYQPKRLF